jgi:hypothetical protein
MNKKRFFLSVGLGMLLGIFCIIGVSQRIPSYITNNFKYLMAAWYNRVIMGIIIGLSGEIIIITNKNINPILRGAIIGAIVSVGFGLLGQTIEIMFFIAGIGFGIINDVVTSKLIK